MAIRASWQLGDVWLAWQPIVDLADGRVRGYEALARGPRGTAFESPAALFASARGTRRGRALEAHVRSMALQEGRRVVPDDAVVFVNVDSRWPDLPLRPDLASLAPERVAIELTEAQPILENDEMLEAVTRWRRAGHPIVLDDYGTGYAAAAALLALQPDILKLDRRLIMDIDRDQRRQAIVHSIRQYTADLGVRLVAEGVETLGELEATRSLGLDLAQGFLLARPASPPPAVAWPLGAGPGAPAGDTAAEAGRDAAGDALLTLYAESIQRANLAAYVVDRQRRIVGWNRHAARATGFGAVEMTGRRCFEPGGLRHRDPDGRPLCFGACPIVWSMVHGAPHAAEVTLATKDGERQAVRILATPIWDGARRRILGAVEQFTLVDAVAEGGAPVRPEEPRRGARGAGRSRPQPNAKRGSDSQERGSRAAASRYPRARSARG